MRLPIVKRLIPALLLLSTGCGMGRHQPSPAAKLYGYNPLGRVETIQYPCSVPGPSHRKMTLYLPPDYDADSTARYPVVYLLHGARGSETTWIWRGHLPRILDSLYVCDPDIEQAIVVMPDMNSFRSDKDYDDSRFKSALGCLLEVDGTVETGFPTDVVGYMDAHFRTIPDKAHRAVAGMSIGGMQAAYLSANNPDLFDHVGLFSPISGTILKYRPRYNKFYQEMDRKLSRQFRDPPACYMMTSGKGDILVGWQVRRLHRRLERSGYPHIYRDDIAVGHEWSSWILSLQLFLERCFRSDWAEDDGLKDIPR